jgi:hypothetical protein
MQRVVLPILERLAEAERRASLAEARLEVSRRQQPDPRAHP